MNKIKKITNLSYLLEISGSDKNFMNEMIEMFIAQVPVFQFELNKLYEEKEWFKLGRLAHKIKSSVIMMGMSILADDIKKLEEDAKQGINIEGYPEIISKFVEDTNFAVKELREYLKIY